jgi:hypothetical protein
LALTSLKSRGRSVSIVRLQTKPTEFSFLVLIIIIIIISFLYSGYQGLFFSGVKRLGRKGDRSPPRSAEVKIGGATPPLSNMSSWNGT